MLLKSGCQSPLTQLTQPWRTPACYWTPCGQTGVILSSVAVLESDIQLNLSSEAVQSLSGLNELLLLHPVGEPPPYKSCPVRVQTLIQMVEQIQIMMCAVINTLRYTGPLMQDDSQSSVNLSICVFSAN